MLISWQIDRARRCSAVCCWSHRNSMSLCPLKSSTSFRARRATAPFINEQLTEHRIINNRRSIRPERRSLTASVAISADTQHWCWHHPTTFIRTSIKLRIWRYPHTHTHTMSQLIVFVWHPENVLGRQMKLSEWILVSVTRQRRRRYLFGSNRPYTILTNDNMEHFKNQVTRKPWGQPCWPPKHIKFLVYRETTTTRTTTATAAAATTTTTTTKLMKWIGSRPVKIFNEIWLKKTGVVEKFGKLF